MKSLPMFPDTQVYLFGFSRWKHGYVKSFLQEFMPQNLFFINPFFSSELELAKKRGLDEKSQIIIWGKKEFADIENFAKLHTMNITRVEDGFIRSVGLGSDLTQPLSLVVDKTGIYFDPTTPSDLEVLLATYDFKNDVKLMAQADSLLKKIKETKISKYNVDIHKELMFATNKRVILVPGQVEDDASIRLGANGMKNVELLKQVRDNEVDAYIVFKPHPDVVSGNRIGTIPDDVALMYCDEVVSEISMASVLDAVDEVHTMTSLTGFEALIYGKKVTTYGIPFYAGWGVTQDKRELTRRSRKLELLELVAATFLLYPRYVHPFTQQLCDAEEILEFLEWQKRELERSLLLRIKFRVRNYLSRWGQKILSLVA